MPGRKNYTREEIENGKAAIQAQLAAYKKLAEGIASGEIGNELQTSLMDFEGLFFNNLTLALDRYYVYRLRTVTGKDSNPLNEVEMISDSIMNNHGIMHDSSTIKYIPEQSVAKIDIGEVIRMSLGEFELLSAAFFAELEHKFLEQ